MIEKIEQLEGSLRFTEDTPDPEWMKELDNISAKWQKELLDLPIVKESVDWNKEKIRKFLLEVGVSIIEQFPNWLDNMLSMTQKSSLEYKFLRSNRVQERHHWKWWLDTARAYDLGPEDFVKYKPSKTSKEFSQFLTDLSKAGPLLEAMVAINYVVETGAAKITQVVAKKTTLDGKARKWIDEHAEGDDAHSKDSRELIKKLIGNDEVAPRAVRLTELTDRAYGMYYACLKEAYA